VLEGANTKYVPFDCAIFRVLKVSGVFYDIDIAIYRSCYLY